jgi:hypothetical protein
MPHRLFTCVTWRLKGEANEYPLKHIFSITDNFKTQKFELCRD